MLTVQEEPWSDDLWRDMRTSACAHFEEVDGGIEPKRPFKLDLRLMQAMASAGALRVIIARKFGRLVGYFTWSITPDVESEGLLIGQQGAWFVQPGNPRAAHRMFTASVEMLRRYGVQCIFPHHRTQGRGANIGRFFRAQGAQQIQHTYSLWIGD